MQHERHHTTLLSLTWMPETFHAYFLSFNSYFRLQLNVCQLTPINKKNV